MADFSKISLFGTVVNVKDSIAREQSKTAVDKADMALFPDIIFVGDSYGAWGGVNWVETATKMIPHNNVYNACVSGSGFLGASNTFKLNLMNTATEIEDKNAIKKIIVAGGYNDAANSTLFNENNVLAAVTDFINYCKATFPKATIYIGFLGNNNATDDTGCTLRNNMRMCAGYYKKASFGNGALYMDGTERVFFDYTQFTNDHAHPLESGNMGMMMGGAIGNFVTGGSVNTFYPLKTFAVNGQVNRFYDSYLDGVWNLLIYSNTSFNISSTGSTQNETLLGDCIPNYYRPVSNANDFTTFKCLVYCGTSTGSILTTEAALIFKQGKLYIKFINSKLVSDLAGATITSVVLIGGTQFSAPWNLN